MDPSFLFYIKSILTEKVFLKKLKRSIDYSLPFSALGGSQTAFYCCQQPADSSGCVVSFFYYQRSYFIISVDKNVSLWLLGCLILWPLAYTGRNTRWIHYDILFGGYLWNKFCLIMCKILCAQRPKEYDPAFFDIDIILFINYKEKRTNLIYMYSFTALLNFLLFMININFRWENLM